jgi:hypothetical protein
VALTVTVPARRAMEDPAVGLVMLTVGAAASSRTVCERGVSSSPAVLVE